jgi:hypothetical protein
MLEIPQRPILQSSIRMTQFKHKICNKPLHIDLAPLFHHQYFSKMNPMPLPPVGLLDHHAPPPQANPNAPTLFEVSEACDYAYRMQGINESTDYDAMTGDEQGAIEVWRHRTVDNAAGAPSWFAGALAGALPGALAPLIAPLMTYLQNDATRFINSRSTLANHPIAALVDGMGVVPASFPATKGALEALNVAQVGVLLAFYGLPVTGVLANDMTVIKNHLHV